MKKIKNYGLIAIKGNMRISIYVLSILLIFGCAGTGGDS